jgi:predicted nucleic acid-binding protein
VIAYVDSSVLARAYLEDELGHRDAVDLLENGDIALVTGSWSRVEVTGALVRAMRAARLDERTLLDVVTADLGDAGCVAVVAADQDAVETRALELVRAHGVRAMDAWHLAVAHLVLPTLSEPGEVLAFATRDAAQAAVALELGFTLL